MPTASFSASRWASIQNNYWFLEDFSSNTKRYLEHSTSCQIFQMILVMANLEYCSGLAEILRKVIPPAQDLHSLRDLSGQSSSFHAKLTKNIEDREKSLIKLPKISIPSQTKIKNDWKVRVWREFNKISEKVVEEATLLFKKSINIHNSLWCLNTTPYN